MHNHTLRNTRGNLDLIPFPLSQTDEWQAKLDAAHLAIHNHNLPSGRQAEQEVKGDVLNVLLDSMTFEQLLHVCLTDSAHINHGADGSDNTLAGSLRDSGYREGGAL